MFKSVSISNPYVPPERDSRDSDAATEVYAAMHKIAGEWQAGMVSGVLIDANTASLVVQVADALNDKNRAKYLSMDAAVMGSLAWEAACRDAEGK